jgi:hypothetical protein
LCPILRKPIEQEGEKGIDLLKYCRVLVEEEVKKLKYYFVGKIS